MLDAELHAGEDASTTLAALQFLNKKHEQETYLWTTQLVYLVKIISKCYIALAAHLLFVGKAESFFLFLSVFH